MEILKWTLIVLAFTVAVATLLYLRKLNSELNRGHDSSLIGRMNESINGLRYTTSRQGEEIRRLKSENKDKTVEVDILKTKNIDLTHLISSQQLREFSTILSKFGTNIEEINLPKGGYTDLTKTIKDKECGKKVSFSMVQEFHLANGIGISIGIKQFPFPIDKTKSCEKTTKLKFEPKKKKNEKNA